MVFSCDCTVRCNRYFLFLCPNEYCLFMLKLENNRIKEFKFLLHPEVLLLNIQVGGVTKLLLNYNGR